MYLEKVINNRKSYENITETEELILTVNKEQTGDNGSEITFKHFWELCIKKASKVDLRTNQVGPSKTKRRVFHADVTDNDSEHPPDLPDDVEDDSNQPISINKMSQLQRRRRALTEEEKLPSYLWKQLSEKPEDWKLWSQISSEGKKKIVKYIPSNEPQGNLHVMEHVFQSLVHQMYSDENQAEDQAEDSADSDDTREHNYHINQARSHNKGDSKLEKASELSAGYPARMMSSREGRDRVRAQEAKSRNASEKSYKTQSNWKLSAARFKGSNKKTSKGLRATLFPESCENCFLLNQRQPIMLSITL